jgi:hypothetical protein
VFAQFPPLTLFLWGLATLLTLILLTRNFVLHHVRQLPFLFLYLVVNLLQTIFLVLVYSGFGFGSETAYVLGWTTQGIVVFARSLAVVELCYLALGSFKGVWGLAARILGLAGLLVLCAALYFGRMNYQSVVSTFEIGLEACIATAITGLFLFARYYDVQIQPPTRLLGLGLGLLSCSKILNDLVFERLARTHGNAWNYASSSAFVGVLLVWIWALRKPFEERLPLPIFKSSDLYNSLIPQVNQRLAKLNDQLIQLWNPEPPKA